MDDIIELMFDIEYFSLSLIKDPIYYLEKSDKSKFYLQNLEELFETY